jgi:hypothetical protein
MGLVGTIKSRFIQMIERKPTFIFMVMPFELCNAPTMFQQAIMESFKEFIRDFM